MMAVILLVAYDYMISQNARFIVRHEYNLGSVLGAIDVGGHRTVYT